MTTITDELERFRQQMIEDARENEVELVRLAADLEKAELGLIAQLRSVIQAHEQRREMFMAELRGFADRMSLPNTAQVSPAHRPDGRDWDTRAVNWQNTGHSGEKFAN
jgi:hypothetical protein